MTKIAFTSCVRREAFKSQPQWQDIAAANPDYLFLLGDQIYMDYGYLGSEWNGRPKTYSPEKFAEVMREKYRRQWSERHFQALFEQMRAKQAVFGVWDDHDFLWNNAKGAMAVQPKHREMKRISRTLFNEFMYGEKTDKPVYRYFDIPGARAIFLDVRYYAQTEGRQSQLLGQEQWRFLKDAMDHNQGLTLLCSGITLTHGQENWSKYPSELEKLTRLIEKQERVRGRHALFIAGDIHANRFCAPSPGVRPCYEIVSSGLAIDRLGLGFGIPFDNVHNWGLLELHGAEISVQLVDKRGTAQAAHYKIRHNTWESTGAFC